MQDIDCEFPDDTEAQVAEDGTISMGRKINYFPIMRYWNHSSNTFLYSPTLETYVWEGNFVAPRGETLFSPTNQIFGDTRSR